MDERLRVIVDSKRVFLRPEVLDLGYDDNEIRRLIRARRWHRVRQGAYTLAETYDSADEIERHRILSSAVMQSLGDRVALSHTSALVDAGIDVYGADLSVVHVTRLDGASGGKEAGVVSHTGHFDEHDLVERDGRLVMRPARALVESATILSMESALVSFDSGLHKGLTHIDELAEMARTAERWPNSRSLTLVLRLADGGAESVGETLSRYLFWREGLPRPVLQFHVYDDHGCLVGITDFAWPEHGLLGEFDGRVKYGRLLKPGQEPGDVVFEEKKREDRLREVTGHGMVRLTWPDLFTGSKTAERVRRQLRSSSAGAHRDLSA